MIRTPAFDCGYSISRSWISRDSELDALKLAGIEIDPHGHVIGEFRRGFRLRECHRLLHMESRVKNKIAGRRLWCVTAHHCNGKHIANDPTDGFEVFVVADTRDEAVAYGDKELEKVTEITNDEWWSSVAVHAVPVDDIRGIHPDGVTVKNMKCACPICKEDVAVYSKMSYWNWMVGHLAMKHPKLMSGMTYGHYRCACGLIASAESGRLMAEHLESQKDLMAHLAVGLLKNLPTFVDHFITRRT